jgi:hypothetical protein
VAAGVVEVVEHLTGGRFAPSDISVQDFAVHEGVGLARFNADGSADLAFGDDGVVLTRRPDADAPGGSASLGVHRELLRAGKTLTGSTGERKGP